MKSTFRRGLAALMGLALMALASVAVASPPDPQPAGPIMQAVYSVNSQGGVIDQHPEFTIKRACFECGGLGVTDAASPSYPPAVPVKGKGSKKGGGKKIAASAPGDEGDAGTPPTSIRRLLLT